MNTGIFIRVEVDGKWGAVDIGDERIPPEEIVTWLRSRGGVNTWAENVVLALIGKKQIANYVWEVKEGTLD